MSHKRNPNSELKRWRFFIRQEEQGERKSANNRRHFERVRETEKSGDNQNPKCVSGNINGAQHLHIVFQRKKKKRIRNYLLHFQWHQQFISHIDMFVNWELFFLTFCLLWSYGMFILLRCHSFDRNRERQRVGFFSLIFLLFVQLIDISMFKINRNSDDKMFTHMIFRHFHTYSVHWEKERVRWMNEK